jgi:iron only hydrogenase large subunit-like protein
VVAFFTKYVAIKKCACVVIFWHDLVLQDKGRKVLSFATAYGFRNIQNITRQAKANTCKYDYVEVMACPAGCVNGGGQIKAEDPKQTKELLKTVDALFHQTQVRSMQTFLRHHHDQTKSR